MFHKKITTSSCYLRQLAVDLNPKVLINKVFVEVEVLLEDGEVLTEPALNEPALRRTFHGWS